MLRQVQFLLQLLLDLSKRHRDFGNGVELENQHCLSIVTQQSKGSTSRGQLQDLLKKGYVHDSICCTGSLQCASDHQ
jgi:hypothetical protein